MLPPRKLAIVRQMGEVATQIERLQEQFGDLERQLLEADDDPPRRTKRRRRKAPAKSSSRRAASKANGARSLGDRLVEALESVDHEMTLAQLGSRTGTTSKQVSSTLCRLVSLGRVRKVARGVFQAKKETSEPPPPEVPSSRSLETRVLDLFQSSDCSLRAIDVMECLREGHGVAGVLKTLVERGRLVRRLGGHHRLAPANEPPVAVVVAEAPPQISALPPSKITRRAPPKETLIREKAERPTKSESSYYLTNRKTKPLPWDAQLELFRKLPSLRAATWCALLESQRFAPLVLDHLIAQTSEKLPDEFAAKVVFVYTRPVLRTQVGAWCASVDPFGDVLQAVVVDLRSNSRDAGGWLSDAPTLTANHRLWVGRCGEALEQLDAIRGRLATSNLGLGMRFAQSRVGRGGMTFPDLVNESYFGLLKAVDRFDIERGFKFSTYAAWWIRHATDRALYNNGRLIRLPVHLQEFYRDVRSARSHVGKDPVAVAKHLDVSVAKVDKLEMVERTMFPVPKALDHPMRGHRDGEDGSTLGDLLVSDELDPSQVLLNQEASEEVVRQVSRLPKLDAEVIRRRFGIGCQPQTLSAIGEDHSLSRERIRQIEARALQTLRQIASNPDESSQSEPPGALLEVDTALCCRVLSVLEGHPRLRMSAPQVGRLARLEPWVVRRACVELLRKNLVQQVGKRFVFLPSEEPADEKDPPVQLGEVDQRVLSHLDENPDHVFSRKRLSDDLGVATWTIRGAVGRLTRLGLIQQVGAQFRAARSYEPTEGTDTVPSSTG